MVSVRNEILVLHSGMGRELALNIAREIEDAGLSCTIATQGLESVNPYTRIEDSDIVLAIITDDSCVSKDFWDLVMYTSQRRKWIILRLTDKYAPHVYLNSPNIRIVDYTGNIGEVIGLISSVGSSPKVGPSNCYHGDYSTPCSPCPAPSPIPRAADTYGIWSPEVSDDIDVSLNSYSEIDDCFLGGVGLVGFLPFVGGLFRRKPKKPKETVATACAYAPAEVRAFKHFIVRVFVLRPDEAEMVDASVKEVDPKAVKKTNKPLALRVKDGSRLSVLLTMSPGVSIDVPLQTEIWKGKYVEFDYTCRVEDGSIGSISANALVAVDNVPKGSLKFVIDVEEVDAAPRYAKVEPRNSTRIFISYSHNDYNYVRGIAEGCRISGSDYFFDRHTLQPGDLFKDKIKEYISNADVFVLCWSKNAAESEWVQIERHQALEIVKRGDKDLRIWALHVPPQAPPPSDMSGDYHFASL